VMVLLKDTLCTRIVKGSQSRGVLTPNACGHTATLRCPRERVSPRATKRCKPVAVCEQRDCGGGVISRGAGSTVLFTAMGGGSIASLDALRWVDWV
jgi:hypothetical protein